MIARIGSLTLFLVLVVAVSVTASGFAAGEWYYTVATRPAWSPPPWLFGPAWAIAYAGLALAAWQARLGGRDGRGGALVAWLALVVASGAWSWLLFGLHRPGWAWLALGLIVPLCAWCLVRLRALSRPAAWLAAPFAGWLVFLWAWNLALWTLNGGPLAGLLA